jgi:hypothetical protein
MEGATALIPVLWMSAVCRESTAQALVLGKTPTCSGFASNLLDYTFVLTQQNSHHFGNLSDFTH